MGQIWIRYRLDIGFLLARYGLDMGLFTVSIWARYGGIYGPDMGQIWARYQLDISQISARYGLDKGQIWTRYWLYMGYIGASQNFSFSSELCNRDSDCIVWNGEVSLVENKRQCILAYHLFLCKQDNTLTHIYKHVGNPTPQQPELIFVNKLFSYSLYNDT